MAKPSICISFHPTDSSWQKRIVVNLAETTHLESWPQSDEAERDWLAWRERALSSARTVVLLVSSAYLCSRFFNTIELPFLDALARRGDVRIRPILVEPVQDEGVLADLPLLASLERPALSRLSEAEVERRIRSLAALDGHVRLDPAASPVEDLDLLFEQLYSESYPTLLVFFGRRGLDLELSRELAQETMLRVYEGLAQFEHRSSTRTWIRRIATNLWANWVRDHCYSAKRGVKESSLESSQEEGLEVEEGHAIWSRVEANPEQRAVEQQIHRQLHARLAELAPRQRQCLRRWLDGLPYQDIVDELGVSMQTVRATLHKAKARITQQLRDDFGASLGSGSPSSGEGT